jgi:hypothetical protein
MDAKALGSVVGVDVGTLNSWISRGYVLGVHPDAQGRRRHFDIETAMHIAIMAELSSFGLGAPVATFAAVRALHAFQNDGCSVTLIMRPHWKGTNEAGHGGLERMHSESQEALLKDLAEMQPEKRPNVYLTIDVGRIAEKIREAEDEWQQRRKKTSGEG